MSCPPSQPKFSYMRRIDADGGSTGVDEPISRKDEVLLCSVLQWYNEDASRVRTFSDIVNHRNGLSLRIIDWLITNFSKAFSVAIESDGLPRNLCRDYHKNLSAHNKKNFDPFARRRRIHILLFDDQRRVSTIGQLNFFRWFLSKDLVGFLLQNKTVIEKHMKDSETKLVVDEKHARGVKKKKKKKMNNNNTCVSDTRTKLGVPEPQVFSGTFTMSF